jgi:hypothetical protein
MGDSIPISDRVRDKLDKEENILGVNSPLWKN